MSSPAASPYRPHLSRVASLTSSNQNRWHDHTLNFFLHNSLGYEPNRSVMKNYVSNVDINSNRSTVILRKRDIRRVHRLRNRKKWAFNWKSTHSRRSIFSKNYSNKCQYEMYAQSLYPGCLELESISTRDSGTFVCRVEFEDSPTQTNVVELTVYGECVRCLTDML